MDKKKQTQQGYWKKLFSSPTEGMRGGLAFSFASAVPTAMVLFAVLLIASFTGWKSHTDGVPNDWYLYCMQIFGQLAFFLSALAALRITRRPLKQMAAKQKCHWKYFVLAILLQIGLFALSEVNGLFLNFLGKFGYVHEPMYLPSMDGFGLVWVLLTVALLPAICEEFLFRGVVLDGLRSFGTVGSVLLCGGLFALFHQDPAQTIYQFCCGAAFALVAVKSGSILPTMLAHFINNAIILLLTAFGLTEFTSPVFITVMCVTSVCLIGSLVYLIFFDKKTGKSETQTLEGRKTERKHFGIFVSFGVVICALNWLTTLLSGV